MMHKFISLDKTGEVTSIHNRVLEKRLYGKHPETDQRISIWHDAPNVAPTFSEEEIINISGLQNSDFEILQLRTYAQYGGEIPRDAGVEYYIFDLDLKSKC